MRERKSRELRREIEHDILSGVYRAGTRLDEQSLADRFGVSRTPIREALQELQYAGLVTYHANRGAFVSQISASDILEMCELRTEFESICGRLAARRGTPDRTFGLARALQACERAVEAEDLPAYLVANDQFHDSIYAMTGNKLLTETASALYHRLKFFRHIQFEEGRARMVRSLDEHREIVAAITSHETERAEELLRQHAVMRSERLVKFLLTMTGDAADQRIAV